MKPSVTFFSGVGNVTGANFLLSYNKTRILVDCGLIQGVEDAHEQNRKVFGYDPRSIGYLFVTHAHMDHIGRIPRLVSGGFSGTIYSTPITYELSKLMFEDALGVMEYKEKEKGEEPLYTRGDVDQMFTLWKTIDFYSKTDITDEISVYLKDSGHILGSSMFEFTINDQKILFTGDLGNDDSALLRPTDEIEGINYMIIDSVYGDRNHEPTKESRERFKHIILDTINRGGSIMIPAFSLDRTQEILYLLNNLVESNEIPPVPVYLDSPLAIKITEVYERIKKHMSREALSQIASGDDIFDFPKLELTRRTQESISISDDPNPKIIIAGSGMSAGGRILYHEKEYLPDPQSTLILVGYQSIGTLGRELEEGARQVKIHEDVIPVRARIEKISGFSAHKDSDNLVAFVSQTSDTLRKVFVVSGEPKSALYLTQRLRDYVGVEALYPQIGKEYELYN